MAAGAHTLGSRCGGDRGPVGPYAVGGNREGCEARTNGVEVLGGTGKGA